MNKLITKKKFRLVVVVVVLVTSVLSNSLHPLNCSPAGFSVHGDSPGKNTGVGCHAFFQGIFPTQGSNPRQPVSLALQGGSLPTEPSVKPQTLYQFCSVTKSCLTLCDPMEALQLARLPCPSPSPRVCSNSCPSSQ